MKIASFMWRKGTPAALLTGCLLIGAAMPAYAGLGADAASVAADAVVMQGTMVTPEEASSGAVSSNALVSNAPAPDYTVKSFVTPHGTTVREYIGPDGTVFGVGWKGHRPPNLGTLLGSYYNEYTSGVAAQAHKDLHRSTITGPTTVVVTTGRFGHVQGHAYVPGLVPSDVDAKAVVK